MAGFMTGLFELRTAEIQSDKVNNVPRVSITNTNGFGRDSENFGQSGSFQLRNALSPTHNVHGGDGPVLPHRN